ncbi:hypothetical protein,chaperonin GroEL,chaperonin GroL,TCP-1/cpn60 chaperonin family [Chlamydia serpentis]|uniref:60 kDa chaperonin n=1 Tax=Chlamydia serpentis TaxID=1967782 RepID=A0A2R8FC38_9CHLA|nr:chaperonin GroEL [Chlamydia serpentis]SPN73892.1 hypothetical protein,chaperonin GroEL,chaperonin GroL,TCP-1/cpn60 chaperonin family [Chlamydia serpentis]
MVWVFKSQFEGLSALKRGVHALAKAVMPTFGPRGYNAVIKKGKVPLLVTKSGIRVAKEIMLQDSFEYLGLKLAKEALIKVIEQAGDGSTTALVLIDAIFSHGLRGIAAGLDPQEIKAGILSSVKVIHEKLQKQVKELRSPEEILKVATLSASYDASLGKMIVDAISQTNPRGMFFSEDVEISNRLPLMKTIKSGYISPYFVTRPETMDVIWEEAFVLILSYNLVALNEELIECLEYVSEQNSHPLIIIAEDFDHDVIRTLIVNKLKNGLPVCAVKAPGSREYKESILEDLAILTGATLIGGGPKNSEKKAPLDVLGRVQQVMITKEIFMFLQGDGNLEAINSRKHDLYLAIAESTCEREYQQLEQRLAMFVGNVPQMQLASDADIEQKERHLRLEAALRATKAAIKGGVVPGGGVALLRAAASIEIPENISPSMAYGFESLLQAVRTPLKALAQNCGRSPEELLDTILSQENPRFGYNAMTDTFEDLVAAGVCDPLAVTSTSLKCAVSISCLLLTSSLFVTSKTQA